MLYNYAYLYDCIFVSHATCVEFTSPRTHEIFYFQVR